MSANNLRMNLSLRNAIPPAQKWLAAIVVGILFLLFSAPFVYQLTNALFAPLGLNTIVSGRPTWGGLIIHAILFVLLLRLLMA